ncbi:MAG: AAA family ATPase, partial [Streptosporangiaceae bacterium]|nr:AAA family ATPase [Streptosporangiaceae bacterium]
MRPHRLEVTAFGAFAATSAVRFDDLEGLFLLHGETGAGKTTLLDAIAFALYGRVPGERGKTRRLRSDHAPAGRRTEVRLEATVGGRRLRITRSPEQERPRKSGEGMTTERARVLLEECLGDGTWQTKSTRAGEADAEIADLMGMSAEQFFQVVLLPQGQFAQFLHSDAEARARLLQRLFGTDRFRAVEDWLAERRRSTAAEVAAAEEGVDVLTAQVAQAAGVPVPDGPPENEPGPADPGTSPATLPGNLPADPGACKPPTSPGQRPLNAQHDHLFAAPPDNSSGASSPEAASFASSPEAASFTRSPEAASFAPSSQGVSSAPSSQGASSIPSSENRWQRAWAAGLLAAAEAERDATAAVARERSRELKAALRAQRAAELLVDRQHRRADALRRDGELRLAAPGIELLRAELDAAERAAGVAPVQDEAERAADAAGAARQAEQDSRAALGADAAALRVAGAAGLRAAVQQRREQLGRLEALRAVALQAADEEEAAAAARAQANALAAALEALHVETARFAGQR